MNIKLHLKINPNAISQTFCGLAFAHIFVEVEFQNKGDDFVQRKPQQTLSSPCKLIFVQESFRVSKNIRIIFLPGNNMNNLGFCKHSVQTILAMEVKYECAAIPCIISLQIVKLELAIPISFAQ